MPPLEVLVERMLFGMRETAQILGISRRSVARLVKGSRGGRAEFRTVLIGRRRLVPHASIKKFVEERCDGEA